MASKLRTESQDKLTGRVYTPDDIVDVILDGVGLTAKELISQKIVDPACGDGQFLVAIAKRVLDSELSGHDKLMALENITGWDIDSAAIQECIANLEALIATLARPLPRKVNWAVSVLDALERNHFAAFRSCFKFVVANPPYIRIQNLEKESRTFLSQNFHYCSSGSTDIFYAFIELAEHMLTKDGRAGFITPNSFLTSEAGSPLRVSWSKNRSISRILNFGHHQIFENASTYAAITFFSRVPASQIEWENWAYPLKQVSKSIISFDEARDRTIWNFNFQSGKKSSLLLKDICSIHVGIQTLADKVFYVTPVEDHGTTVAVLSRVTKEKYLLEKAVLKTALKVSRLVSKDLHALQKERVIWPYPIDIRAGSKAIDEELLEETYPLTLHYLRSHRQLLDDRDNGAENPSGWYAFARQQGIKSQFQPKIVFPPMVETPKFFLISDPEVVVYSGYFILSKFPLESVMDVLASEEMVEWVSATGRDLRGGWKSMSKKILEGFPVPERFEALFATEKLF